MPLRPTEPIRIRLPKRALLRLNPALNPFANSPTTTTACCKTANPLSNSLF